MSRWHTVSARSSSTRWTRRLTSTSAGITCMRANMIAPLINCGRRWRSRMRPMPAPTSPWPTNPRECWRRRCRVPECFKGSARGRPQPRRVGPHLCAHRPARRGAARAGGTECAFGTALRLAVLFCRDSRGAWRTRPCIRVAGKSIRGPLGYDGVPQSGTAAGPAAIGRALRRPGTAGRPASMMQLHNHHTMTGLINPLSGLSSRGKAPASVSGAKSSLVHALGSIEPSSSAAITRRNSAAVALRVA